MQVSCPWKFYVLNILDICDGRYFFFTGAGVCVCDFFCFSLQQVSVSERFSCRHWFRCLGLGIFLCLTSAVFFYLGGFLFLTFAGVWSFLASCLSFLQISMPGGICVPY